MRGLCHRGLRTAAVVCGGHGLRGPRGGLGGGGRGGGGWGDMEGRKGGCGGSRSIQCIWSARQRSQHEPSRRDSAAMVVAAAAAAAAAAPAGATRGRPTQLNLASRQPPDPGPSCLASLSGYGMHLAARPRRHASLRLAVQAVAPHAVLGLPGDRDNGVEPSASATLSTSHWLVHQTHTGGSKPSCRWIPTWKLGTVWGTVLGDLLGDPHCALWWGPGDRPNNRDAGSMPMPPTPPHFLFGCAPDVRHCSGANVGGARLMLFTRMRRGSMRSSAAKSRWNRSVIASISRSVLGWEPTRVMEVGSGGAGVSRVSAPLSTCCCSSPAACCCRRRGCCCRACCCWSDLGAAATAVRSCGLECTPLKGKGILSIPNSQPPGSMAGQVG